MAVMHSKSGLVPSMMVIPLLSEIIQTPPDFFLDLFPSDVIIIGCFGWMKVINGSIAFFSLNFGINFCYQDGNIFVYCLKFMSLDDTLMHIWNFSSVVSFPSSIVMGM